MVITIRTGIRRPIPSSFIYLKRVGYTRYLYIGKTIVRVTR